MIDGLKMANIENTDKNAKLAPLPPAGDNAKSELNSCISYNCFTGLRNAIASSVAVK